MANAVIAIRRRMVPSTIPPILSSLMTDTSFAVQKRTLIRTAGQVPRNGAFSEGGAMVKRPERILSSGWRLHFLQGGVEVGDQVFGVFYSYRQAHQAVGDADLLANVPRNRCMGHHCGMGDQRLHAAQAFRKGTQLHVIQEAPRRFKRAQVEGEHGSE